MKLNLFKKFFYLPHATTRKINPYAHWYSILLLFMSVCIVEASVAGYVFYKINKGEIFLSEKKDGGITDTLDREKLKRVVEEYNSKELRFTELGGLLVSAEPIVNSESLSTTTVDSSE